MNKTVLFEGALLLIIGLISIIDGLRLINMEKDFTYDIFGPGRYLLSLGLAIVILGFIYLIYRPGKIIEGEKISPKKQNGIKMFGVIIAMPIYSLLIPIIGYLFATLFFSIIIHRVTGFRSWLAIAGLSFTISFLLYAVFVLWLNMAFPRGLLFK